MSGATLLCGAVVLGIVLIAPIVLLPMGVAYLVRLPWLAGPILERFGTGTAIRVGLGLLAGLLIYAYISILIGYGMVQAQSVTGPFGPAEWWQDLSGEGMGSLKPEYLPIVNQISWEMAFRQVSPLPTCFLGQEVCQQTELVVVNYRAQASRSILFLIGIVLGVVINGVFIERLAGIRFPKRELE